MMTFIIVVVVWGRGAMITKTTPYRVHCNKQVASISIVRCWRIPRPTVVQPSKRKLVHQLKWNRHRKKEALPWPRENTATWSSIWIAPSLSTQGYCSIANGHWNFSATNSAFNWHRADATGNKWNRLNWRGRLLSYSEYIKFWEENGNKVFYDDLLV